MSYLNDPFLPLRLLARSTGAYLVGYGSSTVGARLDVIGECITCDEDGDFGTVLRETMDGNSWAGIVPPLESDSGRETME